MKVTVDLDGALEIKQFHLTWIFYVALAIFVFRDYSFYFKPNYHPYVSGWIAHLMNLIIYTGMLGYFIAARRFRLKVTKGQLSYRMFFRWKYLRDCELVICPRKSRGLWEVGVVELQQPRKSFVIPSKNESLALDLATNITRAYGDAKMVGPEEYLTLIKGNRS